MEQIISVFGIDWKLLLVQAVNFGIVLFVLHLFLYKPVLKLIDERKQKIEKGVKDAEVAGMRLSKAEADARGIVSGAEREAAEAVLSGKRAAEEAAEAIRKETEERTAKAISEAKREAEDIKRRTVEESQDEIAKLSILAAEKILRAKS